MQHPAMKSSAELGSNCWSALRFTGHCHRCERYDRCTYKERVANEEYDQMQAEAQRLATESKALYEHMRRM